MGVFGIMKTGHCWNVNFSRCCWLSFGFLLLRWFRFWINFWRRWLRLWLCLFALRIRNWLRRKLGIILSFCSLLLRIALGLLALNIFTFCLSWLRLWFCWVALRISFWLGRRQWIFLRFWRLLLTNALRLVLNIFTRLLSSIFTLWFSSWFVKLFGCTIPIGIFLIFFFQKSLTLILRRSL